MGARSQLPRLLSEVGRFLLVGGAATLVALFLFNVLVHGFLTGRAPFDSQPIAAYVVSNTVGMLISYHGSRTYVFRDRAVTTGDGGFTAYVLINAATMTLPVACLALSRGVLGLDDPVSDNIAANGIGLLLGLGARFHLFRTLVFRRPIHLGELYDEPPGDGHVGTHLVERFSDPTATSTSDPDAPPSAAAAAG